MHLGFYPFNLIPDFDYFFYFIERTGRVHGSIQVTLVLVKQNSIRHLE